MKIPDENGHNLNLNSMHIVHQPATKSQVPDERDLAVLDLKNIPPFKEFLRLFRNLAPPVHVHQGGSPIHRVTCGHVCLLFVMGTDQFGGDFRGKASSIVFMIALLMIYDFNLLGID